MILLASSSQTLCRRWRNALAGSFPIHQAGDRQALLSSLQEYKPQVLFLDHSEMHFGPNCVIRKIIKGAQTTRVVVLTRESREYEALELIKAGAKGYCNINIRAPLLCKAAKVVSGGGIWISRQLLPVLFDEFARAARNGMAIIEPPSYYPATTAMFAGLSPREREIASLVASGQQNKSISHKLNISEKTVKAHLTMIFRKLNVDGRTQLALAVHETHRETTARNLFS